MCQHAGAKVPRDAHNRLVARKRLRKLRYGVVTQIVETQAPEARFSGDSAPGGAPSSHWPRGVGLGVTLSARENVQVRRDVVSKVALAASRKRMYRDVVRKLECPTHSLPRSPGTPFA